MPLYINPDDEQARILDVKVGVATLKPPYKQALVLEWRGHKMLLSASDIRDCQALLERGLEKLGVDKELN